MGSIKGVEVLEDNYKDKESFGNDIHTVPSLEAGSKPDPRKLLRKLDRNIIPWVTALYLVGSCLICRVSYL